MVCLVSLPNGTTFGIDCDSKAIGQECLEKVSQNIFYLFFFFLIKKRNSFRLYFLYICIVYK